MITETKSKIISYIKINKQARVDDLVNHLDLSNVAIHKQLRKLIDQNILKKIGSPPLVFYALATKYALNTVHKKTVTNISDEIVNKIQENYLYISPSGEFIEGFEGFLAWAKNIKQEKYINSLANEYIKSIDYKRYINAISKFKSTFKNSTAISNAYYSDFYSLPKFGKTKLGQFVLYAKQSQKRDFIEKIVQEIRPDILNVIKVNNIDAVSFVPPTIPRKLQFITEVEKLLNLNLPKIELVKVSGDIIIPQKTLSKLDERVENARNTIYLKSPNEINYKNILLIDDATGSGATFNEVAKKIEDKAEAKITAYAIVGSIKGFDVISEV